MIIY